jgi:nucleoside-diphosphate-sugar epimerase
MAERETVLITGASGFIGRALASRLAARRDVIGLDLKPPREAPRGVSHVELDLTSDDSVRQALRACAERSGGRFASIVHLAAYFDLSGEDDPKYEAVTVRGTERLVRALRDYEVGQFLFSSTMLVHKPCEPGERIDESWPIEPAWAYPKSKVETEALLRAERGAIPLVLARMAGVYDDMCRQPFIARQIARIYERKLIARFYPGDLSRGQAYLHLDDLAEATALLVERRAELPAELPLLLGEADVMSYGELQAEIGRLLHGEPWETQEIPAPLAKLGVWMQDDVLQEEPFIQPWMVESANAHYALDIGRAEGLGWRPARSLRGTLPRMTAALQRDPVAWYGANKLNVAKVAAVAAAPAEAERPGPAERREHREEMRAMRLREVWTHLANATLGLWLIASPLAFGCFDEAQSFRDAVLRVTAERGLPAPEWRMAALGVSDLASGALLLALGLLALSERFRWAQWGAAAVGFWLLFAPLVFWAPIPALYANDTAVGALAIAFAVLIPMMPGMSHQGMMQREWIPPGWDYSPSSWSQRAPIIAFAFFGFFLARHMAAYQLGHIETIWDPFFGDGTRIVITSDVSKAWPVPDAGLGAAAYMLEALMGLMGDRRRWRTMPWMVAAFFVLVAPLGFVSILFIVIQPIVIGTWCSLCLLTALFMVIMIPYSLDEIVASGQFMYEAWRDRKPLVREFFMGGAMGGCTAGDEQPFGASFRRTVRDMATGGVSAPWTLLASAAIGLILMFTRVLFGAEPPMADSDHLVGALAFTVAISAMADVGRALRFINVGFGLWLVAAPWLLDGDTQLGAIASMILGLALVVLSLPRGRLGGFRYGAWDRFVV